MQVDQRPKDCAFSNLSLMTLPKRNMKNALTDQTSRPERDKKENLNRNRPIRKEVNE